MAAECDVLSEIEVLQSIYVDELQASRKDDGGWVVSLVLYPSTAEDSVSQFVRLTLTMTLDLQYPSSPPSISIHNPRGLSDDKLSSVHKSLQAEAESCLGSPVLYQLIEKAKEILTESNIPHGNCVICLYGFKGEVFTKTSCYHYFHSHCLGRYVTHSERELQEREKELEEDKTRQRTDDEDLTVVCPVCREPLMYDMDQLLSAPAPRGPKLDEQVLGADFRQKWCELRKLLERQRAKGGIIDPEVESNRFLIHINKAPADTENDDLDADASPSQSLPAAPPVSANELRSLPQEQQTGGHPHRRGGPSHRRQGHFKGPRRGGRGRPQQGRHGPPTEQMDKLSVASDSPHCHPTETPLKARGQADQGQQKAAAPTELNQSKTRDTEGSTDRHPEEAPPTTGRRETCQPSVECLKTDGPKDTGESARNRGGGRRRGPHGPRHQPGHWHDRPWDAPGAEHHHWDGQGSRSGRGRAGHPCGRGGGARRGHGRGLRQKAMDREVSREGVL